MTEFVTDINQLLLSIISAFGAEITREFATAAVYFIILVFLILVQTRAKKYASKDKDFSFYEFLLLDLVIPFIYLLFVKYSSSYLHGEISNEFFAAVSYFYIGNSLIQSGFLYSDDKNYYLKVASLGLLFLSLVSLMLIKYNALLLESGVVSSYLFVLFKLSVVLLVYILLFLNIKRFVFSLPGEYQLINTFLKSLVGVFTPIYFILSVLWLVKIIRFTGDILIGIVLSMIGVAVLAISRFYIRSLLAPRVSLSDSSYTGILKSINFLLSLILFLFLFKIFKYYFNLQLLVDYLRDSVILNTDLIKITVYALLASIFVLVFIVAVLNVAKHGVHYFYTRRGMHIEADSMRQLVFNLGLLIAVVVFLSKLGFTWKALLPVAGALGIGVGIGLQNIMNNYISGFILLFSRKLKMGDVVELEGNAGNAIGNTLDTIYGKVSNINLLSTLVQTTDGIEIIVPNSHFIDQKVVNYSLSNQFIRVRIPFGVSYQADPETVRKILLEVAEENSSILKNPSPGVWFSEMADSALIFNLLVWVDIRILWKITPVVSDIYFTGWYKLKDAGVEIPFPQRDVWFKNRIQVDLPDGVINNFKDSQSG